MGAESLLLGRADGDNAAKRCAGALVGASAGTRRRKALLRGRRGDRQNDAAGEKLVEGSSAARSSHRALLETSAGFATGDPVAACGGGGGKGKGKGGCG